MSATHPATVVAQEFEAWSRVYFAHNADIGVPQLTHVLNRTLEFSDALDAAYGQAGMPMPSADADALTAQIDDLLTRLNS
ncbi:MAG: hypothetical protein ABL904_17125 [Hyphomicrobiaceae bacterium]